MEVKKIDIRNLIKEVLTFCGENVVGFLKLFGIALAGYLVFAAIIGAMIASIMYSAFSGGGSPNLFLLFVIGILMIGVVIKYTLVSQVFLFNLDTNVSTKLGDAWRDSKGRYWGYIGYMLLIGLIMLVPMIIVQAVSTAIMFAMGAMGVVIATILISIPMVFLQVKFMFIPVLKATRDLTDYFDYNNLLLEGSYKNLVGLFLAVMICMQIITVPVASGIIESGLMKILLVIIQIPAMAIGMAAPIVTIRELEKLHDPDELNKFRKGYTPEAGQQSIPGFGFQNENQVPTNDGGNGVNLDK